jgi:hypothetical protein
VELNIHQVHDMKFYSADKLKFNWGSLAAHFHYKTWDSIAHSGCYYATETHFQMVYWLSFKIS